MDHNNKKEETREINLEVLIIPHVANNEPPQFCCKQTLNQKEHCSEGFPTKNRNICAIEKTYKKYQSLKEYARHDSNITYKYITLITGMIRE